MTNRSAFRMAERHHERPPTKGQHYTLTRLSTQAGIELPTVRWRSEARDAIKRLKKYLEQPMLEGWRGALT
jgi:hypothetical protein